LTTPDPDPPEHTGPGPDEPVAGELEPHQEEVAEAEPPEGESAVQDPAQPPERRWPRPSQWLALAVVVAGAILAIIGPTIESQTFVLAGEVNPAAWVRPAGLIVVLVGLVVGGLDVMFQREQARARKVINETPTIHIHGTGHRIALGDTNGPLSQIPGVTASDAYMARQDEMLRDSYLQTIAQAKVIFWVSLVFMCLGGLILLVGALSAVRSGGSAGKVEAGIVTAVSGALANLASATFLYQANRSRAGLAEQAASMQARSIADRRITVVREIAAELVDNAQRDNSLKELMSALARSVEKLDGRHSGAPPEPAGKSDGDQTKPRPKKRKGDN